MRNVNGPETEGKPDTQQTKSPSFFQQHLLTYTGNALMGDRRLDMRSIFRVTLYIYNIAGKGRSTDDQSARTLLLIRVLTSDKTARGCS